MILDFFSKSKCFCCGRFCKVGLCVGCINQFQKLPPPFCNICKSNRIENALCQECLKREPLFKSLITVGVYNGLLKNLIYNYKYESQKKYTLPFADLLLEKIIDEIKISEINYVSCIPLHKDKQNERGFNQAELLARRISKKIKKPFINLISRIKKTKPQFSLNAEQRAENLKDAFKLITKKNLHDKTILIIDDIFTTGTTLQEACRILQLNSVKDIYIAVLARSLG